MVKIATFFALQLLILAVLAAHVCAQDALSEQERATRVETSSHAGMFLPLTMAPRTDSQRAFARAAGGYDTLRRSPVFDSTIDVTIWGPIALRVGFDYGERADSKLRPSGGARVQALKQERHGIDMSLGAFYRPEGFTEAEGEIEAVVAFGRRIDRWGLFANLVYGQDPEAAERDAELRLATVYDVTARLQTGLDARLRVDLGSEEGKRRQEGEADYDVVAGPLLSYSFGVLCLIANAGFHGIGAAHFRSGFVGTAGLGGSL